MEYMKVSLGTSGFWFCNLLSGDVKEIRSPQNIISDYLICLRVNFFCIYWDQLCDMEGVCTRHRLLTLLLKDFVQRSSFNI